MWPFVKTTAARLLDVVLPRRDRIIRLETYIPEQLPLNPTEHEACGFRITTLLSYRNTIVEDAIRALKYDGSSRAAQLLADALAEYLHEEIATRRRFSKKQILLIPVPLHHNREHERGFNQIGMVLDALPPEFQNGKLSRVAHVLSRIRETVPQTTLSRDERLENVHGAFSLTYPDLVRDAQVILIDDVTTTGATLTEASRPLVRDSASCTLLALARA